nr:extracellular solute-binding protein [uncultured Mediterraneibacter sp.]
MIKNTAKRIYLVLICVILYAPILTLMVLSFNNTKTRSRWGGFTGKWYISLFQNDEIMSALYTTLIIALLSALIATLIGTAAALGMQAMSARMRTLFMGITNIPMLNADIVTGVSMMLLFIAFRFTLSFNTILLAHITFNIPYVILSVLPKLKQTNRRTYEAALDLGATPLYAFYKVVLPDIMPGIFSGFLLAFTMSLDDFVITHFTKGPGVDTLSTKIYSEVRKGIKPEMYALSTIMFLTVLLLLILVNMSPADKKKVKRRKVSRASKIGRFCFQRLVPVMMVVLIILGGFVYMRKDAVSGNGQVIVYNWGEYIDPDVIDLFEEETGIDVVYEEYETNEIMYPKIQSGAIAYDVVCPSDYMIQRMIDNDLLAEINYDNIPNLKYIDDTYMKMSQGFDPENKYSVPYLWGTVGILYNKSMVDEPVDSWGILWDEKYKDSILMQDSVRDAFAVALKYLGYSLNSTDLDELQAAKNLLIEQKPLVQAYVIDQVRDKMIGNEAALGVIYSGEALYCQEENPDLEYAIPKEGTNLWIDSWVIPKNAKNKENAEAFINFLCKPEIAKMNFEYITYSIPNTAGRELIEDPAMRNSTVAFPDVSQLTNCETFNFLGDKNEALYNELWREVKSK